MRVWSEVEWDTEQECVVWTQGHGYACRLTLKSHKVGGTASLRSGATLQRTAIHVRSFSDLRVVLRVDVGGTLVEVL